jgi:glyoxylase-like metal-dependent hydrolase (beta-lactamase superfamily II)
MQIADGIHRLGTGQVNSYLVADGGGVTVVDAGLPGYWSDLQAELAAMGRSLDDLRAIVLTHGHSDHLGFAEKARRERGVPVSVHEADALLARGRIKNPAKGTGPVRPLPLLRFIVLALRTGGWHIDRLGAVATYGDGATLDVPGSPRVVLVPGHTPGSAALHLADRGVLFVGDAFATVSVMTGTIGPQVAPFTADAEQAVASLDRLAGIEAPLILPGHGEPWTGGTTAAIAAVRARESAAAARTGRH